MKGDIMATSAASIALQLQQLSNQATEKSFKYNTQEATTARNWQTQMSNTSHQREVEDLKKAGLNPVLSSGGSGAQSYTTSSASAQAADPTSAVGNVWSSQIGADATRAAAAQSAKAMKYAASQQAAAARYAAAMQYESTKYAWDSRAKQIDQEYAQKIKLVNSTPTSSIGGVLDKIAQRSGLYDLVGTKAVKNVVSSMKKFLNTDPSKYFSNSGDVTKNNFQLNKPGKAFINQQLQRMGIGTSNTTRNLLVRAVAFRDPRAIVQLAYYVPRRSSSARATRYRGYTLR